MEVSKFNEKFNRVDGNIYTIEEVVTPIDGTYEAELIHDNVELKTINVYTGPKLTGTKINTYSTSTPSLTPWKIIIKIFSTISPLYITYETTGDQVEAEDINNLQDSVNITQEELNKEVDRATKKEDKIQQNLNTEVERAKDSEKNVNDNLNNEITRSKNKENELLNNIENETKRASATESKINADLNTEINRAKNAEATENTRAINKENVIEKNLNVEIKRATDSENNIIKNLEVESNRAKKKEEELNSNINTTDINLKNEVNRSTEAEKVLTDNLANETNRAKGSEKTISDNLLSEANRAKKEEDSIKNNFNSNKPNWDDAYSKRHIHNNKNIIDALGKNTEGDLTFEGGKIVSTTINGLTDDIILEGGNNVTVTKEGNKIVVSTAGGQEKIVTNTPINVSRNDWLLDTNSNDYKVTIQHNLNDTNIIISVYNETQKLELVGIMIKDTNSIILSNSEPIDCRVIINSSGQPTEVIDNLNSSESNKALSAKQGKILKDLVNAVQGGVTIGKTLEDAKPISLFLKIID